MNHLAFDGASGETVLFFLTHAMLVIAYVWLSRNLPSVCKAVPTPLAILLTNVFAFGTSPLCTSASLPFRCFTESADSLSTVRESGLLRPA